jgi:hypothetical protein
MMKPNNPAAPNAAMTSLFQGRLHWLAPLMVIVSCE